MVGYLANSFLPARAGEVLRSVLISRGSALTSTYALTTALSERLMDVIAVVAAAALALFWIRPKPTWLAGASWSIGLLAVAGAAAVAVLPRAAGLTQRLIAAAPLLPDKLRRFLHQTTDQVVMGVRAFHHPGRLSRFAALTMLIWLGDGIGVLIGARALGLTIPLPVAMLLLTAMALGSALPSTPGYVGIYQAAAVTVLGPFGVGRDKALAYSFLAQAISYVVITAVGLPCLLQSREAVRVRQAAAPNDFEPR
jgi:uncharacterized protein (TIRG00374 family)